VILFEVPMLAIISEVRNRYRYQTVVLEQAREQLYRKFDWLIANASSDELAELQVADFGTRRRFSYRVQEEVVSVLKPRLPRPVCRHQQRPPGSRVRYETAGHHGP